MLDADQQKIVDIDEGYWKILATAGAGKSETLLRRAGRLHGRGSVLCVTFTAEATKNLRSRCVKLFPHVDQSIFSTLHALALKFTHAHPDAFPFKLADNPLADEGVSAKCVFESIGDKVNFRAFTQWMSVQKRKRVEPSEAVQRAETTNKNLDFAIGYKRYDQAMRKKGLLDFDDLLRYFCDILETRPDLRGKYSYQFVQTDESQDLSDLDWRIVQLLSKRHGNLLSVGDCGQNLFSFRGSDPEIFRNMEKFFPGTQTLYLSRNYRSTPEIISFGRRAYPYEEIAERFQAVRESIGIDPVVTGYSTDYREAEETVEKIKKYNPDECAVLARTNAALRCVEEELINQGIKYHCLGDEGFWQNAEVQNVLAYIRCACAVTDNAVLRAIQTPFWPTRYVKKKQVVEQLRSRANLTKSTVWSRLGDIKELKDFRSFLIRLMPYKYLPAQEAARNIIKDLKAIEHYREEQDVNPDRNPVDNIREIARSAARFESLDDFLNFVRKVSFASQRRIGVCLSTVHSAKGKEWSHVFLISVNKDILPHAKCLDDIDGEKCVFFVGASRAEDTLDVSYHGTPSPFLEPWLKTGDSR